MFYRSVALALLGGVLGTAATAQDPLQSALQGAVEGARLRAAQDITNAVNDSLNIPNQQNINPSLNNAVPSVNRTLRSNPTINNNYGLSANGSSNLQYNVPSRLTPQMRQLGLQPGDTVVDQYGNVVTSPIQMQRALSVLGPNAQIERNGQTVRINASSSATARVAASSQPRRLGIRMEPAVDSVIVSDVNRSSLAAKAGLLVGDHILAINGQTVHDPNMVSQRVNAVNGDQATFLIDRNGQQQELVVYFVDGGSLPQPVPRTNMTLEDRVADLEQHVGFLLNRVEQLEAEHAQILADHARLEGR